MRMDGPLQVGDWVKDDQRCQKCLAPSRSTSQRLNPTSRSMRSSSCRSKWRLLARSCHCTTWLTRFVSNRGEAADPWILGRAGIGIGQLVSIQSLNINNLIRNFDLSPNQIDFIRDVNHKLVTMTNWMPDLAGHKGPRYRAIAETLAEDVRNGRLAAGTRLPTHRDLAWKLRVTIGTISRAYAEAKRRGLIVGEVGRGTFVRPPAGAAAIMPGDILGETRDPDLIDLTINRPCAAGEGAAMTAALVRLAAETDLAALLDYQAPAGRQEDRVAGTAFLKACGLATTPEQVVATAGGQHAMFCVIGALARPGDTLAVEALTYPGLRALANLLHLRLTPIALDGEGLIPEALEAACRAAPVRALYTMPTLHNPTTATMPVARRKALAEVARRHDLALLEDDVYGFLLDAPLPPLAHFAPERVFYITSTSKPDAGAACRLCA